MLSNGGGHYSVLCQQIYCLDDCFGRSVSLANWLTSDSNTAPAQNTLESLDVALIEHSMPRPREGYGCIAKLCSVLLIVQINTEQ